MRFQLDRPVRPFYAGPVEPRKPHSIVFDLGNVLVRFRPDQDLAGLYAPEAAAFLLDAVFRSQEWVALDRGTLTDAQATAKLCARHPGREDMIREAMRRRQELLTPIPESVALLAPLLRHGHRLLYLSNYHASLFEVARRDFGFLDLFEGGVISSHVELLKPEPAIYRLLLDRWELVPDRTLFIDDSPENVEGARICGIHAVHLPHPSGLAGVLGRRGLLRAEAGS